MLIVGAGCVADDEQRTDQLDAVVRVQLEGCGSLATKRATAVVAADLRNDDTPAGTVAAITVAHTFVDDEGHLDTQGLSIFDRFGEPLEGELVWLDAERDLAVLDVRSPIDGLRIGSWSADDSVALLGFSAPDQPVDQRVITVDRRVGVTLDGGRERTALELTGDIAPGDSGGPLVNQHDEIVGIVFAATRGRDGGWATDASELDMLAATDRHTIDLVCG